MTALGLDVSLTSTGYAWLGLDDTWNVDTIRPQDRRGGCRLSFVRETLASQLLLARPALAVLEGYSFASVGRGRELAELGGVVRELLWRSSIPFAVVQPSTLKRYATGRGDADKYEMLQAAEKRAGMTFSRGKRREDECDAWWLACMGLDRLGQAAVELPKANRAALAAVTWPGQLDFDTEDLPVVETVATGGRL